MLIDPNSSGTLFVQLSDTRSMTVETCIDTCVSAGYIRAGLIAGSQCCWSFVFRHILLDLPFNPRVWKRHQAGESRCQQRLLLNGLHWEPQRDVWWEWRHARIFNLTSHCPTGCLRVWTVVWNIQRRLSLLTVNSVFSVHSSH